MFIFISNFSWFYICISICLVHRAYWRASYISCYIFTLCFIFYIGFLIGIFIVFELVHGIRIDAQQINKKCYTLTICMFLFRMVFSWYFMSLNWLIECIDASNEILYFEDMFIFISDFSWFKLYFYCFWIGSWNIFTRIKWDVIFLR